MPEVTRELADALIEVVRERMTERGMTITALALVAGMNQQTLNRHLRGEGTLTVDEFDRLGRVLGTDLEGLLEDARTRM